MSTRPGLPELRLGLREPPASGQSPLAGARRCCLCCRRPAHVVCKPAPWLILARITPPGFKVPHVGTRLPLAGSQFPASASLRELPPLRSQSGAIWLARRRRCPWNPDTGWARLVRAATVGFLSNRDRRTQRHAILCELFRPLSQLRKVLFIPYGDEGRSREGPGVSAWIHIELHEKTLVRWRGRPRDPMSEDASSLKLPLMRVVPTHG